jgi:hypothetical protein
VKERTSKTFLSLLALVAAAGVVLAACTKPARTDGVGPPTPTPQESNVAAGGGEQPKTEATPAATPPTLAEARDALERVYRRAVVLSENPPAPFLTGDFNGDGSEDIAIAVGANAGMLAEINSEFANWIVEDPKKVAVFDAGKVAQPAPAATGRVQVEARDALLAVIHGHGRGGWRDPLATQSYLLKNAAGEEMRAVPLRQFPAALKVKKHGANSRADIISLRLGGVAGFLYWTGGKYAWHEQ